MEQKLTLTVSRMEGTSNAKCRLWRLRLFCGGKPAKSKRFHGTYSQAKAAGEDFRAEYAAQLALTGYDPDMTFERYAQRWLQRRKDSGNFENQTLKSNKAHADGLCKVLGGVKVAEMKRTDVVDALAKIKAGAVGGSDLMNSTLIGYHTVLKQIMEEAVRDELIARSPVDLVKAPKSDAREKSALPFDCYMRLIDDLMQMRGDSHAVGILVIALNGLRRSEAVALDWEDDLGDGIAVLDSIEDMSGNKKSTKSPSGKRIVPMTANTRQVLDDWRLTQALMLRASGIEQTPHTPIITNAKGERMAADTLYRWWKKFGPRMFGVSCTLHDLRHTFLTYLAKNGDAFALKRIAGWSKIAMADTYVHADDEADRAAMGAFERRIGR